MCLAPKHHFHRTTKAPVGPSLSKKVALPNTVKASGNRPISNTTPTSIPTKKSSDGEGLPSLVARPNHRRQASRDIIFRVSASTDCPVIGTLILPLPHAMSLDKDAPESPPIERTFSFCSASSELTTTSKAAKRAYNSASPNDLGLAEEKKEEATLSDWDRCFTPLMTQYTVPSTPSSPRPASYTEEESVVFPEDLWLPAFQ